MRIRWTPEAATDLQQIARHILRDNPSAARSVVRTLTEGIERLSKFPNLGRPGQVSNTRELVFASLPYIAIYRLKDEVVEILRIYHGAQDWP